VPDETARRRHLLVALAANAVAAAVKLVAFALTGASVLLSEGVHSIADCGNQAALLLGHRAAAAPASAVHPLGRGRVRYLWAFLVAVVIFGGSAAAAFADATYRLLHPEHHPHVGLMLAALAVAGLVEGVSFAALLREAGRARRPGEGWLGFISRSRDPDLPVLLVEDLADLVGVGLALVGTLLADVTGVAVLDALASYLIAGLLAANAVFLAWQMASLVLGEAPDHELEAAVLAAVDSDDDDATTAAATTAHRARAVQAVHLGPDELLIIIEVAGDADAAGGSLGWLRRAGERAAAATPISSRVLFDVPAAERAPEQQPNHET
jgi:cation diffusion facilitator family transporter